MDDYETALQAAWEAAPDGEQKAQVAAILKLYRSKGIAAGVPDD